VGLGGIVNDPDLGRLQVPLAGGDIFIRSLKLMVVPLVFVSLVCGAASLGGHGSMGRVGGKTVGLYLLTTGIAITIALILALLIAPGEGASSADIIPSEFEAKPQQSIKETLVNIFPTNPVSAMAEGRMLQVIVFALLLGVALSRSGSAGQRVIALFDDLEMVYNSPQTSEGRLNHPEGFIYLVDHQHLVIRGMEHANFQTIKKAVDRLKSIEAR